MFASKVTTKQVTVQVAGRTYVLKLRRATYQGHTQTLVMHAKTGMMIGELMSHPDNTNRVTWSQASGEPKSFMYLGIRGAEKTADKAFASLLKKVLTPPKAKFGPGDKIKGWAPDDGRAVYAIRSGLELDDYNNWGYFVLSSFKNHFVYAKGLRAA